MAVMPDGEALLLDRQTGDVVRLQLRTGLTREFARRGSGPGEYRRIASMLQLSVDTVALWDAALRRLMITSAGERSAVVVSGGPPGASDVQLVGRCADGGVAAAAALPTHELDTLPRLGLFCLRGGAWVATAIGVELRARPLSMIERARNGVRSRFIVPRVFAAEDQVVVRADGTLLVARAGHGTVELRAPDGALRRQQHVRVTTSRVSAADMDTTTAWRGRGLTEGEEKDWLVPAGSVAGPDGSLLVMLQPADGRSSVRVMQMKATLELWELFLAPGSRLIGWDMREQRVITAREEDDGVRLDWVDSRFKRGGGRDR